MNRRAKHFIVQFRNLAQLDDLTRLVKAVRNIQSCRCLVILLLGGLVVKEQSNKVTTKKTRFPILGGKMAGQFKPVKSIWPTYSDLSFIWVTNPHSFLEYQTDWRSHLQVQSEFKSLLNEILVRSKRHYISNWKKIYSSTHYIQFSNHLLPQDLASVTLAHTHTKTGSPATDLLCNTRP